MKRLLITTLLFSIILINQNISAKDDLPKIIKAESELSDPAAINPGSVSVTPVLLPHDVPAARTIEPQIFKSKYKHDKSAADNGILNAAESRITLFAKEYIAFEIDPAANNINIIQPEIGLSPEAIEALDVAPIWLYDQLIIKFRDLMKIGRDDDFAKLIIDAEDKYKDEVAFCVANMSFQSLTDSRFMKNINMIIRNAELIYQTDPLLNYVDLVEYGSIENRDYYTTTKYRIYDTEAQDTVWSEIPREIYYWYIVHPKMDQEGVYTADNGSDNSGQRTYGYAWREYIWDNPDPDHDYTPVNITTQKGSVESIPVFGEIMQMPTVLWDRTPKYLQFGRDFDAGNTALDVLGNWASRALPVDVKLPRAFQPNQILMKHNGNCNEDAFLVAGACRTALIPIIYLSSSAEDHVYGAIWDKGWHHFEFFRGGLQVPGNDFYGITNMLPGGGYGWETSMVQGFRPDGYILDLTEDYANTCTFNVTVVDSKGTPIEGVMAKIFAPYGNGFATCSYQYTDREGKVSFMAGEKKRYLINLYHPVYGHSPEDPDRAFFLAQSNTMAGREYNVNVPFQELTIENPLPLGMSLPNAGDYSFALEFDSQEIITGISEHDNSQKSRFYKWNSPERGIVSIFLCDADNYSKFAAGEEFSAYNYTEYANSGRIEANLPGADKYYLIIRNSAVANICEHISAKFDLMDGSVDPARPALLSPYDNSVDVPVNARLAWREYPSAAEYRLQVSANADFSEPIIDESGISGTSFDASGLEEGKQYFWRIGTEIAGETEWSDAWDFTTFSSVSVAETLTETECTAYPNPFSQFVMFRFPGESSGSAELSVYSPVGELVGKINKENISSGMNTLRFDSGDLPSGAYYYRLRVGGRYMSGIIMLAK
ncbi:MAG: hypothetical protein ACLFQX_08585 [Candidatus Kapaibacterium sp.]